MDGNTPSRVGRDTTVELSGGPADAPRPSAWSPDWSIIDPDLAVEVVSPSQTVGEMIHKCRKYLAHGVQVTLVVDPITESIVRALPDGTRTTLRGDDRIDASPLLPDFEVSVRELFDTLRLD